MCTSIFADSIDYRLTKGKFYVKAFSRWSNVSFEYLWPATEHALKIFGFGISVGGSRGRKGRPLPGPKFLHFHTVFGKKIVK